MIFLRILSLCATLVKRSASHAKIRVEAAFGINLKHPYSF